MHNRRNLANYISLLQIIISVAALLQLYIAYNATGGIDVDVYWTQGSRIDYTIPRYYQEPVSWEIIRFLANVDRAWFPFAFSLVILFISIVRLGIFGGFILYAAFLSPFGIMMEFNVLRQCLGTVFLIFLILAIVKDNRKAAAFWALLSILSHNSLILVCGFVIFMNYYAILGRNWRIMCSVGLIFFVIILEMYGGIDLLVGARVESFSLAVRDDRQESLIYLGFALIFSLILYFGTQQKKWRPISFGLAACALFTVGICTLLSLDSWVYGRIAMTVIVVCHFLLLYDVWETRRIGLLGLLFLVSIIVVNGVIILFHPGAMSMIEPYNV